MPSHLLKWCLIICKYTRSDQKVARLNWYLIYIALRRNTATRNKHRHVIAHSSNVGSSKFKQCAVLELIVDILEVPTTSISILFLEDGGSMSFQNFDNHLWNCSYPYPKSIILIFSAVKTSQAHWEFIQLLELFMVRVNCFCYIWI